MAERICEGVYLVGGPELSHPADCLVYLVDLGELVLIDCGAGPGWPHIKDNIAELQLATCDVHTLVLTHAHIDHVGAAAMARRDHACRIVAHELDAEAIETGDPVRSAASWYRMRLEPAPVDLRIHGKSARLELPAGELVLLHTPGHTPGSMVAVLETAGGERVVFGQDIHGPFSPSFGSDLKAWRSSMRDIIGLEPDVLCEGHHGVFRTSQAIIEFIEEQLAANG